MTKKKIKLQQRVDEAKAAYTKIIEDDAYQAAVRASAVSLAARREAYGAAEEATDKAVHEALIAANIQTPHETWTPTIIKALEEACGWSYANRGALLPKGSSPYTADPFSVALSDIANRVAEADPGVKAAKLAQQAAYREQQEASRAHDKLVARERGALKDATQAIEALEAYNEAKRKDPATSPVGSAKSIKAARVILKAIAEGLPVRLPDGREV